MLNCPGRTRREGVRRLMGHQWATSEEVRMHREKLRSYLAAGERPFRAGGDEGNRTPNPCLAKAVLCQLSYVPEQYSPASATSHPQDCVVEDTA